MTRRAEFWRAMFWTATWAGLRVARFAYEMGVSDGKASAWREANQLILEQRTYWHGIELKRRRRWRKPPPRQHDVA